MTESDQKFIEDPLFIKWIFRSNSEIDGYWHKYIAEHPEEADQLTELKVRLSDLRYANETLGFSEKAELSNRILTTLDQQLKKDKRRSLIRTLQKYAAIALILASGIPMVYLFLNDEALTDQYLTEQLKIPVDASSAILITSTGKSVDLLKSHSTVDYSRRGSVVLNNDSVLETAGETTDAVNQLVVPYGYQSQVVLSDNTVVWLNAGSRLVYPTQFKGKTREVLLFGEAFFDVSKNPEQPFIVNTGRLNIKVLGTKFNVSAYAEDNLVQTVLKEGSVSIIRKDAGIFDRDITIRPNQLASFDKTSKATKIYEVEADDYALWTKGLICFEDHDFSRVIQEVERFYNISVRFSDPQKKVMRISGKLDLKQSRTEALEYLEKVSVSSIEQLSEHEFILK